MFESFDLRHDFTPVPGGDRRYIAEEGGHPALSEMPVGTSLVSQGNLALNMFSTSVTVAAPAAGVTLTMPKRVFLTQPNERRKIQSAKEKEQIDTSESARNEHIVKMSHKMSPERVGEIIRAVLAALYSKDDSLPANPFRNDDTFSQAVAVVKAADLKANSVPHRNAKGESTHIAHRRNIRTAVARLMGMEEHHE